VAAQSLHRFVQEFFDFLAREAAIGDSRLA
jgi:hypothetical protein